MNSQPLLSCVRPVGSMEGRCGKVNMPPPTPSPPSSPGCQRVTEAVKGAVKGKGGLTRFFTAHKPLSSSRGEGKGGGRGGRGKGAVQPLSYLSCPRRSGARPITRGSRNPTQRRGARMRCSGCFPRTITRPDFTGRSHKARCGKPLRRKGIRSGNSSPLAASAGRAYGRVWRQTNKYTAALKQICIACLEHMACSATTPMTPGC